MNILLTGAGGFLGKALLRKAGPDLKITTLDRVALPGRHILCDITDETALRKALSGRAFHAVIHLAGLSSGSPEELFLVNVRGTANLAKTVQTRRFVIASSCAVYGEPRTPDGAVSEGHPTGPVSHYGRSMLEREHAVPDGVALRLFNIIGPGQRPGMLVPDLAGKLARIALGLQDGPLVTGPLTTERDYLDVSDAAGAFLAAASASNSPGVLNVGSGMCHTGMDVLNALAEAMGVHPEIVFEDRPSGVFRIRADIRAAAACLGFKPGVSFSESLGAVADDWLNRSADPKASSGFFGR